MVGVHVEGGTCLVIWIEPSKDKGTFQEWKMFKQYILSEWIGLNALNCPSQIDVSLY